MGRNWTDRIDDERRARQTPPPTIRGDGERQVVDETPPRRRREFVRCQASTKAGRQCRMQTVDGGPHCRIHREG